MIRKANKSHISALLLLSAIICVGACKKEEQKPAAPAPKSAVKPVVPVQKRISSALPAAPGSAQLDFTTKKDPFKPFVVVAPKAPSVSGKPRLGMLPIQNYDVAQFKVIGIVAGLKENRAMIVDPAGKGYVVRPGMLIGKNDGRITRITSSAIEVLESYRNDSGKVRKNVVKLTLPRKE